MKWFSVQHEDEPVILDYGYLQRLSKHIGERETRELLADAMLDLTDRLAILDKHGQAGNLKAVADLMHEIAGAAGHQGLTAMSHAAFEACRLIQQLPNPNPSVIADMVLRHRDASIAALAEFCNGQNTDDPKDRKTKP